MCQTLDFAPRRALSVPTLRVAFMVSEESQNRRAWLLERLIIEVRAYANADNQTRLMRLGRMDGYLEVGVAFGYWSRRSADLMP